ncbi:hypothetical protein K7432_009650 [Basidiobolus ranarum]|uniref:Uncharacterized protein n=1 Tax=Basidiobolus ranarum TaxID=34480 RepID=A0ABR2VWR3_9FUNG
MLKFFKSKKSPKYNGNTDGLRDNINAIVDTMDQVTLFGIVDSRYPSDPMKEAYNERVWRESCNSSKFDISAFPDDVSLRSFSKRSSIVSSSSSSSTSVSSSSSEENTIRLKNGFQLILTRNEKKNRVEVRVYRDGRFLKRREIVYHLTLAQKYQKIIDQQLQLQR